MARAPCCFDKAGGLMVSAGLVIEMSMVKSTSGRFRPGPRAPAAPELVQGNAMGQQPRGKKGKGGSRAWGHLSLPMTRNDSAEKPRSPGR